MEYVEKADGKIIRKLSKTHAELEAENKELLKRATEAEAELLSAKDNGYYIYRDFWRQDLAQLVEDLCPEGKTGWLCFIPD